MSRSTRRVLTRRPRLMVIVTVVAVAIMLQLLGTNPAVSQSTTLIAHRVTEAPGLEPDAGVWGKAPAVEVPLTAQQVSWPSGGSIPVLEARAIHSEGMLYIRMSWADDTKDTSVLGVDKFMDAAAVEFPAQAASSVPSICMGQTDGGVNIWQWRAGNEDGLPESIEDLSPTGYVDRYPSTEDLYFPARAAGNLVAQSAPVQDLVAVGFGTLTPAVDQGVEGKAAWEDRRWSVVFARELSTHATEQVELGVGATVDIAFAVWDGSEGERNGIKSVSQFVVLELALEEFPHTTTNLVLIVVGVAAGVLALVVLLGTALGQSVNRSAGDTSPRST
jgi:hypothetical protein